MTNKYWYYVIQFNLDDEIKLASGVIYSGYQELFPIIRAIKDVESVLKPVISTSFATKFTVVNQCEITETDFKDPRFKNLEFVAMK